MIFDPFQLVPTATEIPLKSDTPLSGFTPLPSLIPQLPPSQYVDTKTKTVPKVDNQQTFDFFLNKSVKETIPPAYEYTFEEEKRYSNPYIQFNPKPLGGYDTEDIYGNFQGAGEQLWNSLVKTGATAATSFVSSSASFGSSIDSIRQGKAFEEDSVLGQTQGWLKELENDYPNYYTKWEREHPLMSALTPTGAANFWGDKVLKNVGFTIGSLASALLVDAGIELATGGAATPASFILAANQIKRAISPLKNAFRNLSKASTLNKVDDLEGLAKVSGGINQGLKNMNQAFNLKKGLQFAGVNYFAAQGEAMIEGYQTYWDTRAKLYQQELDKGSLTLDKIQEIEESAQDAANTTSILNLPVIMASNLIQFPTILGGGNLLKKFDSPFLDVINKEGLTVVNNYSKKQAWVNTMKELGKDFVTEGGEEGYQYYVGSSIHDYYVDKFNDTGISNLSDFLGKQISPVVKDEKFWESFVIGGLAGGLMGAHHTIKRNLIGANERTERARELLQPIYNRFNSTVKDYVHTAETIEHSSDENPVNQFHTAHKALYSTVHDSLKYGIYDNFQDNLNDLKELPVEEYNKLFDTKFNEQQKYNQLNQVQRESERIKDDLVQVNKFFQKNPFDSPYVNQRLRDVYKIDQTQVENVKVKLFEDFKELTAYNISRLRNTRGRIGEIEQELKMMGIEDSIIPVLDNLDSQQGVNQYKRLKAVQLEALKDQVKYYEELEQPQPELQSKVKSLEKLLKGLDKYDKELTEPEKESVRQIIFKEEIGERQLVAEEEFKKKQDELAKQQKIAVKTAEELEDQTTKPEQKVKEQVETLSKIIPPETKKVDKPKIDPNIFNKQFGQLNEGDQFKIDLSTESGVFTLLTKSPFVAEKDGVKYQFTPSGVTKFKDGEQRLRYALDNIGVEKVESAPVIPEPISATISSESVSQLRKEERKKITIGLLENDGDVKKTFLANGYIEIDGIFVHPQIVNTFKKLSKSTIDLLKNNGIVYVDNFSAEGAAGLALGYSYNNQSIMGIGLADLGLHHDPNKIALHEIGHIVWEKQSKEIQDLFYDGNPVTAHGKKVLNPTGKYKDLYGQGKSYGEEDFAELFAENNGDIGKTVSQKQSLSTKKPVKETISQQIKIKEAADKARVNITSPVKDGIYLLDGDNKFAWRYIDENFAVPLTLTLTKGKLSYKGDMTNAIEKKIERGYLLDDQYIQQEKRIDVTPLLEEPTFGVDIRQISEEQTTEGLTVGKLAKQLKEKEQNQLDNLNQFITKPISESLRQVLEWRLGKGIRVDC